MASLATIFGSGAMTNSLREIEGNEVIFIIGSNTKESHPVIANMMIAAKRKGAKLIVADPRRVPMCSFADLWLRQRPGTDISLLNCMARVIVDEGLPNERFIREQTVGFDAWKSSLAEFTPEAGERMTGVPKESIIAAARLYGSSRKAAIYYTMGITQQAQATGNVNAIANLALLTGNIGRENTGINPLRGQNNVQGASDAGCLPNVYPGYQKVNIPEVRKKFEAAWAAKLSEKPGLTATEMMQGAGDGSIRALYVMGENPALGDPNCSHTAAALSRLDLLIVQDIFLTETARLAHVVLPAVCFAEKDGTFTNTERRVQRVRKAVNPPGEARDDLWIISELSRRMGYDINYCTSEDFFEELGSLWPALEGITYSKIQKRGIQWPCPTRNHPGSKFLYKGGFPRGKASFTSIAPDASAERDPGFPFIMSTGRNLFQYHYGSMTRRVTAIESHAGKPYLEMNPADAAEMKIADADRVRVSSRTGSLVVSVRLTDRVGRGEVFLPLHYAEAAANALTDDTALDRHSKTPRYKISHVKIEPAPKEASDHD